MPGTMLIVDRQERVFNAMDAERPRDMTIDLLKAGLGVIVSSTETAVFRLLGRADTDVFREISKLLR